MALTKRKKNPYAPPPKVHTLGGPMAGKYAVSTGPAPNRRTYSFTEQPGASIIVGGQRMTVPGGQGTTPAPTPTPAPGGVTPQSSPMDPGLPLSMSERAGRDVADRNYNTAKAGYGNQLYQAALRYGDPETIRAINSNPDWGELGPVVENPAGRLPSIARDEARNVEQSGLRSNANNTFFSGLHLRADQEIHDQASRERLAAQQEYEAAMQNLTNLLAQAGNEKYGTYAETGASAIDRVLGREPIPGAGPPSGSPQAAAVAAGWTPKQAAGGPSPGPGWKWDAAHYKWVRKK